jgi:hypothetical protein
MLFTFNWKRFQLYCEFSDEFADFGALVERFMDRSRSAYSEPEWGL